MTASRSAMSCLATLLLLALPARAEEPKKPVIVPARILIERLRDVERQDIGYSAFVSGVSFLPLGQRETHGALLFQQPEEASETVRSLVQLGAKTIPALLDHLSDDRKTKIVIEHAGPIGEFKLTQDKGEKAEEEFGEGWGRGKRYTLRVGDLCYVALGQIVNRPYTAVHYVHTANVYLTSVPHCKDLQAKLRKEWGGLTAEKHRDSLARDLDSDDSMIRTGASFRLVYYYPDAFEPLILKQLAQPMYIGGDVWELIHDRLYPAKSAKKRQALVDGFVMKDGAIARDGIRWELFKDLVRQEADEEGRLHPSLETKYQARECLKDVFSYPANVKSKDKPKTRPLNNFGQAEFIQSLLFDRSTRIDSVIHDMLTKIGDEDVLAEACMDRLIGRGHDAAIEAFLKRRLPQLEEQYRGDLQKYEAKLGWTRLHVAVDRALPYLIENAIKDGVDVDARGKDGRTALHLAAAVGDEGAVELLLRARANPNVKDGKGRLPVELSSSLDYPPIVHRLVARKSEVPDVFTAVIVGDKVRLGELLKEKRERARDRSEVGLTPLHMAAREGQVALMRMLLDAGAKVNTLDVDTDNRGAGGYTPLLMAVMAGKSNAAKLLIDHKADLEIGDEYCERTPLHYAVMDGNIEMVKILLAAKANRDAKDKNGDTPLTMARQRKDAVLIKLLEGGK